MLSTRVWPPYRDIPTIAGNFRSLYPDHQKPLPSPALPPGWQVLEEGIPSSMELHPCCTWQGHRGSLLVTALSAGGQREGDTSLRPEGQPRTAGAVRGFCRREQRSLGRHCHHVPHTGHRRKETGSDASKSRGWKATISRPAGQGQASSGWQASHWPASTQVYKSADPIHNLITL